MRGQMAAGAKQQLAPTVGDHFVVQVETPAPTTVLASVLTLVTLPSVGRYRVIVVGPPSGEVKM
jgi:hypothetical protein